MSYTEHTWQTGETITAAKMNNIEEGIQEAAQSGGGGNPVMVATAGVGSSYYNAGYFSVAKWDSNYNQYVAIDYTNNSMFQIPVLVVPDGGECVFPSIFPLNLPTGYTLVWVEYGKNFFDEYNISGDVSAEEYNFNNGSVCDCRIVTGNSISLFVNQF